MSRMLIRLTHAWNTALNCRTLPFENVQSCKEIQYLACVSKCICIAADKQVYLSKKDKLKLVGNLTLQVLHKTHAV